MTKISDHIDMLEVPLVAQTPVRVTLVNGGDFAVLIDTGTTAMAPAILELIRENAGTLDRVRLIINTHAHHDHIGANHQVKLACGALLAAPARNHRLDRGFRHALPRVLPCGSGGAPRPARAASGTPSCSTTRLR